MHLMSGFFKNSVFDSPRQVKKEKKKVRVILGFYKDGKGRKPC